MEPQTERLSFIVGINTGYGQRFFLIKMQKTHKALYDVLAGFYLQDTAERERRSKKNGGVLNLLGGIFKSIFAF